MAGIYAIYSKTISLPDNNFNRFFSSNFSNIVNEEIRSDDIVYGRSTVNKFMKDRFLFENDNLIISIEGLVYSSTSPLEYILDQYSSLGIKFVKNLKGQFCGFVYDKEHKKFYAFTDHVSSKPLYYHISKENQLFTISSEGKFISSLLGDLNLSVTLDTDSIKSLLIMGFLFDDSMPINEMKKLRYGSILEVDLNNFKHKISPYFSLEKKILNTPKKDVIEEVDVLIKDSVKDEWSKDVQYGYDHYSFLSGGLDSRVNLLLAHSLGFNNISTLTFSEPNTSDHLIADTIAQKLKTRHTFIPLNGDYLLDDITSYIKANDGLTAFLGSAHVYYSINKINFDAYGSMHSGQIGDVLFGSFAKHPNLSIETVSKFGMIKDPYLTRKIERLPSVLSRYEYKEASEVFAYEQRQFNLTFNGDRTLAHFFDMASPFYNKELLQYCLNIPQKFKINEGIYLDWFNEKLPLVSKFKWDKIGFRPTSMLKVKLGFKRKDAINRLYSYFNKQYDHMNPFKEWFSKNPNLLEKYTRLFDENISVIEDDELRRIFIEVFNKNHAISKMVAVSTLFTVRLYLNKL